MPSRRAARRISDRPAAIPAWDTVSGSRPDGRRRWWGASLPARAWPPLPRTRELVSASELPYLLRQRKRRQRRPRRDNDPLPGIDLIAGRRRVDCGPGLVRVELLAGHRVGRKERPLVIGAEDHTAGRRENARPAGVGVRDFPFAHAG